MQGQLKKLFTNHKLKAMTNQIAKIESQNYMALFPKIDEKDVLSFLDFYGAKKLSDQEKTQFLKTCVMNRLNPFNREAHISAYGEGRNRSFAIITGYEVYIKRAEITGLLKHWNVKVDRCKTFSVDQGGNFKEIDDLEATITIERHDWEKTFVHSVKFSEQVQKTKDGYVTKFWRKAEQQLKKVATSQGFRLCFSVNKGLPYTGDEMQGVINIDDHQTPEVIETPKAPQPTKVKSKPEVKRIPKKNFDGAIKKIGKIEISPKEAREIFINKGYVITPEQDSIIDIESNLSDEKMTIVLDRIFDGTVSVEFMESYKLTEDQKTAIQETYEEAITKKASEDFENEK